MITFLVLISCLSQTGWAEPPQEKAAKRIQRSFRKHLQSPAYQRRKLERIHYESLKASILGKENVSSKLTAFGFAADSKKVTELFHSIKNDPKFPSSYKKNGCDDRAHFLCDRIQSNGIHVGKIWLGGDYSQSSVRLAHDTGDQWGYHVAPVVWVRTPSGNAKKWVIDPTLADRPLRVAEWTALMKIKHGETEPWVDPDPARDIEITDCKAVFPLPAPDEEDQEPYIRYYRDEEGSYLQTSIQSVESMMRALKRDAEAERCL